jgi:hypothetical protein
MVAKMKYLTSELYDAAIEIGNKRSEQRWKEACACYEKEFRRIKHKFPHDFLLELEQGFGIHDRYIQQISIDETELGNYSMYIRLGKPEYNAIILRNVSSVQLNNALGQPWVQHEILPAKKGRFSLETVFFGGGKLYVEFKELEFKKGDMT